MIKLTPGACAAALVCGLTLAADPRSAQAPKPPAVKPSPVADGRLRELAWLAGEWRGKAGETDVVTWNSDPEGGMIVMATKELEGGKVTLFDFGVVSERPDGITFVPYPFGRASVAFRLEGHDEKVKRARFVNAEHDFPREFVFERNDRNQLTISLAGLEKGEARRIEYVLTREKGKD